MFSYFRDLLCELKKIRLELEKIRLSSEETAKNINKVSGSNGRGFGYIRTGGKYD